MLLPTRYPWNFSILVIVKLQHICVKPSPDPQPASADSLGAKIHNLAEHLETKSGPALLR